MRQAYKFKTFNSETNQRLIKEMTEIREMLVRQEQFMKGAFANLQMTAPTTAPAAPATSGLTKAPKAAPLAPLAPKVAPTTTTTAEPTDDGAEEEGSEIPLTILQERSPQGSAIKTLLILVLVAIGPTMNA